ncbi:hypothetical protein GCM10028794_01200 [Silanimonas algicola]
MTTASRAEGGAIRRRAVVLASSESHIDLRWVESQCRGCVGCGGRCGLFAAGGSEVFRLERRGDRLSAGEQVDVEVEASRLRRAAGRAYGVAILALVAGAALGHALGAQWSAANAGALVGLLLGTFLAGRWTKRPDAPPLRLRPCLEPASESAHES